MRALVLTVLLSAVAADTARAEPILEPYAPFRLVAVMPDTGQVLLWNDKAAEYRLVKTGDDLDGWRIGGLDLKDPHGPRVALQKEDLIDELELVRLPRPGAVIVFKDKEKEPLKGAKLVTIEPTVIDAKPPEPPPPLEESHTLLRSDLDREINDFDRLMATLRVSAAPVGGFTIEALDAKSWVASLGFKKGDVVRTVAGEEVSSVEDAARVYARLRGLESFVAEVDRGSQKVILKFAVKQ